MTIFLFSIGLSLLWFGADRFIGGGRIISAKLHISPIIVGLTLGALGTSLPEMIVSWMAASVGNTSISIGNAVGSNMANIGLALGIGALFFPIPVEKDVIKYDYWVMLFLGIILYIFSLDLMISRLEGIVFILLCFGYVMLLGLRHHFSGFFDNSVMKESLLKGFFFLAIGIVGLALGAKWVVTNASDMARALGMSETVIGITVVALGTSLPELAVVIAGSIKKAPDLSIGTIVGSNIFNIALVAGGAAVISPIPLQKSEVIFQAPAVVLMSIVLLPIILTGRKITRSKGIILIAAYLIYMSLLLHSR